MSAMAFGAACTPGHNPLLYQVNTRTWLHEISAELGRTATLDDIPDADLDELAASGFDLIYLLGVWRTGAAARAVSRSNAKWRKDFEAALSDLTEEDICGSSFALTGYSVAKELGGDEALERLRTRLHDKGLSLILDFVPNHTAPDHPWVREHPEYYVRGTEEDLAREPQNYARSEDMIFAHGRDPYFDGWPDTLQLDYSNPALQTAMKNELARVAERCDGVRCDMAMLVLPHVFERTWAVSGLPFWPEAIATVKERHPQFLFMAEVYWDLEWELQQQGFDYTYDKRLYDRLVEGHAPAVRDHLRAALDFQERSARFLENHDEPRAAVTFPFDKHRAAAVVAFCCPGLRFFHEGQAEGAKLRSPTHLCRRAREPVDERMILFYTALLGCLSSPAVRQGYWHLIDCLPAWDGNWTDDCFVAQAWRGDEGSRLVSVVNFAPNRSQCYLPMPFSDLGGTPWLLVDRLGRARYRRDGDSLMSPGLYLDLAPWGYHVFELLPETDQSFSGTASPFR